MIELVKSLLRFVTSLILLIFVGDKVIDKDDDDKPKSTPTNGTRG